MKEWKRGRVVGLENKAIKVRGAGHCSLTRRARLPGRHADKAAAHRQAELGLLPHHSGPEPRRPVPWGGPESSLAVCQVVDLRNGRTAKGPKSSRASQQFRKPSTIHTTKKVLTYSSSSLFLDPTGFDILPWNICARSDFRLWSSSSSNRCSQSGLFRIRNPAGCPELSCKPVASWPFVPVNVEVPLHLRVARWPFSRVVAVDFLTSFES